MDNDQIVIQVKGETEKYGNYAWDIYLENKTDKKLMFSADDGIVNGAASDPLWVVSVEPGKKCNETIYWSDEELKEYGIDKITQIQMKVKARDYDDYSADPVFDEVVTVYPLGKDKVETVTRKPQESDIVLFETDQVSMRIIGFYHDDFWGFTAKVYLENKADASMMFAVDDGSVNGFMLDPFWATTVPGGSVKISEINWEDDKLAENGIEKDEDIEEIELKIHVYDGDNWGDYIVDDTFTFQVK